jgi:hypothetical protein
MRYSKNQKFKGGEKGVPTTGILLFAFCLFLFAALPSPRQVFSQAPGRGTIAGKIIDAVTKEPLPGVNVLVQGTARGAVTDFDGNYRIPELSPGDYAMVVSMIGYTKVQRTGVKIAAGETVTINFDLQPTTLAIGQEVVIIGERPLFKIDETSSRRAVSAQNLAGSTLENVQEIVANQVGVVKNNDGLHIRGGRAYENAYLMDGVSVQDPLAGTGFGLQLSTDAIEDLEVITGGIDAEFGQAMSGVVNVVTKEGQREFRGSISYKSDHFGAHDPDTWLLGNFSSSSPHSFETDVAEASLSGRDPLFEIVLPAMGVRLPGDFTFFGSGIFCSATTAKPRRSAFSSIFYGSRFAPRQIT